MAIAGRPEGPNSGNAAVSTLPPARFARPRRGVALGALPRARYPHGATPVLANAGAKAPDLRRALLPGVGTGAETQKITAAPGNSLRNQCRGPRSATPGASLSSHESAKTGPGRNRQRYALSGADAPPAAGGCGIGQDYRRPASHAGGHRERLPDRPHGAHGNPGNPALPGSPEVAGAVATALQSGFA